MLRRDELKMQIGDRPVLNFNDEGRETSGRLGTGLGVAAGGKKGATPHTNCAHFDQYSWMVTQTENLIVSALRNVRVGG